MANLPRGTVTFPIMDIDGSTRHWEADRKAKGSAVSGHLDLFRAAVRTHRGNVRKMLQDSGRRAVMPACLTATCHVA
jgi:class 3 adenylate cyclase